MSTSTEANVTVGMFGNDSGHDFKVIEQRESELKIEYLNDGATAWFIRTRFERDETGELRLI